MRSSPTMADSNTKQVRVDNWGIFFLQRLQLFFSKTDFCDMTLQFEGNVQLKVHRLVMSACTDYFQFLEQTCSTDDNVVMMPADLQADVIVPIVNFMYTGMLEFHLSIFDTLYRTAELMNITILTKLLDAQKSSGALNRTKKKQQHAEPQHAVTVPAAAAKKAASTKSALREQLELPATLPGRKLPVWKRKTAPTAQSQLFGGGGSGGGSPGGLFGTTPTADRHWSLPPDPLYLPDNPPKPTRFDWPDDDLPSISMMDSSFEEISYTSRPLLTQEEENRASTSFEDLRQMPSANRAPSSSAAGGGGGKKGGGSPGSIDMEEVKSYVKEQRIRSGLRSQDREEYAVENEPDESHDSSQAGVKRKAEQQKGKTVVKRVRFDEQELKSTTISVSADGKGSGDLDHSKIVSEILKKYPQLVKKNKNIRLKIMAKNKTTPMERTKGDMQLRMSKLKPVEAPRLHYGAKKRRVEGAAKAHVPPPWVCERCSSDSDGGGPTEFGLYYLYRKHMTDMHNESFDPKLCKYCGHRCNKNILMLYHLYTKHGLSPPTEYSFPKCTHCPYIAIGAEALAKHKARHAKSEIQCVECKLAFTGVATLSAHVQITGHTGTSDKNNYDCQYCTKRFQSGANLFTHVRQQHRNEAIRDGMVSVEEEEDEMDDYDEDDEEEMSKDEYILPEIISEGDGQVPKKVNILSNVKVQDRHVQELSMVPSSEAEALNNVATGIATSLGLVDIVVLNDNQQIFLRADQQGFAGPQGEQTEFILPELSDREGYGPVGGGGGQGEVLTTADGGVIAQSVMSGGDIGSTDELVMVLTDHDYGDNQEDVTNENSNIVVLYSHPVDGQQDQYITSQGNLMVNSQTGMIEIRNGATITSAETQMELVHTNSSEEAPVESIEMIQREIEIQEASKQEYEVERKPEIEETGETSTEAIDEPPSEEVCVAPGTSEFETPAVEEAVPHEEAPPPEEEQTPEEGATVNPEQPEDLTTPAATEEGVEEAIPEVSQEGVPQEAALQETEETQTTTNTEEGESMEVDNVPEAGEESGAKEGQVAAEQAEMEVAEPTTEEGAVAEGEAADDGMIGAEASEVVGSETDRGQEENAEAVLPSSVPVEEQPPLPPLPPDEEEKPPPPPPEPEAVPTPSEGTAEEAPAEEAPADVEMEAPPAAEEASCETAEPKPDAEKMDVQEETSATDPAAKEAEESVETGNPEEQSAEAEAEAETRQHEEEPPPLPDITSVCDKVVEAGEVREEQKEAEEAPAQKSADDPALPETAEQPNEEAEASTSHDDNSQSSQESMAAREEVLRPKEKSKNRENHSKKISHSILDDWEDTDSSQQSDQKERARIVGETVDKLMDDWEEEDEEDFKKSGD